jgi:hypothetical protein
MNNDQPGHRIPWLTILFVLAALWAFFKISADNNPNIIAPMAGNAANYLSPAAPPMRDESMSQATYGSGSAPAYPAMAEMAPQPAMYPDYNYGGQAAAKDTREFNKIYFNASMRTRDVPGLTKLVETTVRGNGGRVDQISSSEKSGYVSFVVPKDEFDDFREQIESFVDWRFLTISINSQNMLPQKQGIEEQQDYTKMSIDQLNSARKTENSDYAKKKAGIQTQIDANDRESAMLSDALVNANDATRPNILSRQMSLTSANTELRKSMASLEQSHLNSINSIDAQIKYMNSNMDRLEKQDQNLMDDVETVSGNISVNWISLWEIIHAYLPGYWIPGLLLALALAAHWWHRKKLA